MVEWKKADCSGGCESPARSRHMNSECPPERSKERWRGGRIDGEEAGGYAAERTSKEVDPKTGVEECERI